MIAALFQPHSFLRSALAALALSAAFAGAAPAQTFPDRPIKFLVPAPPSSPPDLISRIIANELSTANGWTVVIENKPGAAFTLGARDVMRAPADGYTIFAPSIFFASAPALLPELNLNIGRDFVSIVRASASYNALVVTPSLEAKSVSDLIALMKSKPGKLNFASGGFASPAHLVGELFLTKAGVSGTHVPFALLPQAFTELISGRVEYMFATLLPVTPFIRDGKLRALAVTAPKRLAAFPDLPTVTEAGYPELTIADWVVLMARAGTPPEITAKINAAVNKALKSESVLAAFKNLGADPAGGTPAELDALMAEQIALWSKVVSSAGIKMAN